jgi:hypothetical protein
MKGVLRKAEMWTHFFKPSSSHPSISSLSAFLDVAWCPGDSRQSPIGIRDICVLRN